MKVIAIARRILLQLSKDRRTLAMMFVAPLLILTLINLLLNSGDPHLAVAVTNGPVSYTDNLYAQNVTVVRCDEATARNLLENETVGAIVHWQNQKLDVQLDGSNATKANLILQAVNGAKVPNSGIRPDLITQVNYIYGEEELTVFEHYGSSLIGIIIFFLVFLISGISFVQERTSGTLEKLLSTPVKRWEIVVGYTLGFGVVTIGQSILITLYVVYGLNVTLRGSLWLVLGLTLLAALSALTMGMAISSAASNEFQMVQFIPIVVLPQIFLSGFIELNGFWDAIGHLVPIYYIADGLQQVMIKGKGLMDVWPHFAVLLVFSGCFMLINVLVLKRHRKI